MKTIRADGFIGVHEIIFGFMHTLATTSTSEHELNRYLWISKIAIKVKDLFWRRNTTMRTKLKLSISR
jgi:hypothetical protein